MNKCSFCNNSAEFFLDNSDGDTLYFCAFCIPMMSTVEAICEHLGVELPYYEVGDYDE